MKTKCDRGSYDFKSTVTSMLLDLLYNTKPSSRKIMGIYLTFPNPRTANDIYYLSNTQKNNIMDFISVPLS